MIDWLQSIFEPAHAGAFVALMLDVTVKGLLILALAGLVTSMMRGSSSALRHLVWCVAVCALLCLPLLSAVLPSWRVPGLPGEKVFARLAPVATSEPVAGAVPSVTPLPPVPPVPSLAPVPALPPIPPMPSVPPVPPVAPAPHGHEIHAQDTETSESAGVHAPVVTAEPAEAPEPVLASEPVVAPEPVSSQADEEAGSVVAPAMRGGDDLSDENIAVQVLAALFGKLYALHWTGWMLLIWGLGFLALVGHFLMGHMTVRWLIGRAQPLDDPGWRDLHDEIGDRIFLTRPVRLLRSPKSTMPVTWGVLRPGVLMPESALAWPEGLRRCVLLHEFAHIKRYDCLTQMLAQGACALFWFNPLVWIALRRMQIEREKACDDYVLNQGMRASDYASSLLEIARALRPSWIAPFGAVAMARPTQLEGRVLSILDPRRRRGAVGRVMALSVGLFAAFIVFPLASVEPDIASRPEAPVLLAGQVEEEHWLEAALPPVPPARHDASRRMVVSVADDFVWADVLADGKTLEVKGVQGDIVAEAAEGKEAEVRAGKSGRDVDAVAIAVEDHAKGVTICALYPTRAGEPPATCDEEGWKNMNLKDNDVRVDFVVRVPKGVHFTARTIDGDVRAVGLAGATNVFTVDGDIEARATGNIRAATVDGDVDVETTGWAEASTVDGDIHAVIGKADWAGTLKFNTVEGDITLVLPENPDTELRVKAQAGGDIRSVFPLRIGRNWIGQEGATTLGKGGQYLEVSTFEGDVTIVTPTRTASAPFIHEVEDAFRDVLTVNDVELTYGDDASSSIDMQVKLDPTPIVEAGMGLLEGILNAFDWEGRDTSHVAYDAVRDEAVQALVGALQDEDAEIRAGVVQTLGDMEEGGAVDALSAVLRRDPSAEVRRKAAWALGEIGDAAAVPSLMEGLGDESHEVRRMAAWALGEIGDPQAGPALAGRLGRETDDETRCRIVWALGELSDPRTIKALALAMEDANAEVRSKAVWALAEMGDERAVPALTTALRDADPDVRRRAVYALRDIDDHASTGALSNLLKDDDAEVRLAALGALADLEDPAFVDAFSDVLLHDGSAEVRSRAASALGCIGDAAAVPALSKALKDADREVRRKAAWAMGQINY